jgi:hypothetical protein
MKTIIKRMKRKTPKFFIAARNIGLCLTAIGTAVAAAPVALPVILVKIAGYTAVAGGVMSAVSQSAVVNEKK